jgi:MFS family permease
MNFSYVVSAYPAGWFSDRTGRLGLLVVGMAMIIGADAILAIGVNLSAMFAGIALWGLHMGFTQGIFAALVADTAPAELRGSGFGVFNFVSGVIAIFSSLLAGALWGWYGPAVTFVVGGVFSAAALAGLVFWWLRFRRNKREVDR